MKKFSLIIGLIFPSLLFAQAQQLSLKDAIQTAVQNNYDVVITKNQAEIAAINNNWGTAGALPVVSATANKILGSNNLQQDLSNGTTIKKNGASVNNLNAGLAASWTFFDGLRMFATKKRLEELEKIGQLNFTKMVNETTYDVIVAYFNIVRLQQQARATKEVIGLYEERFKVADARFRIGTAAKPDMLQAQVDLNEQRSNLLTIENSISIAKTDLNTFLARDPATPFNTTDSFTLTTPVNILSLQQKIDLQNPDVLVAQSNLFVLMQRKREINADRLPTATLNGFYNFVRNRNSAGFTLLNQTSGPSGSIGITVPIFNGGIIKRQLEVINIEIKNQDIITNKLKNQLQSNLAKAYLNYSNGLKLVEFEQKNMELVKENNFINLERFKKLSITSVELRQGQINYTDAQTRLINAQYQAKIAEAEMLLLVGEISL
ncbi:MAG: TolC family protein [Chitinophagaceae bacterium]|nr:TolC family protein [Chitinophagaceae bacterium]